MCAFKNLPHVPVVGSNAVVSIRTFRGIFQIIKNESVCEIECISACEVESERESERARAREGERERG
jgi:hypothetical protein